MIRRRVAAEKVKEEKMEELVKKQVSVLMRIADVAKIYGFSLAVGSRYRSAADELVLSNKSYNSHVKINNMNDSEESIIFKRTGFLLARDAEKILSFDDFAASSMELYDRSMLAMAEQVEQILLNAQLSALSTDDEDQPVQVALSKYWKCGHCGSINDALECSNCGAHRET